MTNAPTINDIVAMLTKAATKLQSVDYNLSDELLAFADRLLEVSRSTPTDNSNVPVVDYVDGRTTVYQGETMKAPWVKLPFQTPLEIESNWESKKKENT